MPLLMGQTIYPNHENAVGNELGAIPEVFWEDSYTSKGVRIPAGINAKMKLDAKSNPKIARAINMTPPAVHSTSVTVEFLWEKSHATMTEEDFWRGLGKFDKDGNMIRRIATAINRYNELSLVTKGADPFAQKVGKDGKINNPTEAGVRDQQKARLAETKIYFIDYQTDILRNQCNGGILIAGETSTIPTELNNTEQEQQNDLNMNKTFLLALAAVMGLTGDKFSEANITEDAIKLEVTSLMQQKALILKFKELGLTIEKAEDVQSLKETLDKYNLIKDKDVTKLEEFRNQVITELREKTKTLYLKKADGKPSDAILAMLEGATREVLTGLSEQYTAELEEKFPMTCSDCGSHAVSRAAAQKTDTSKTEGKKEETKNGETAGKELTLSEIIAKKKNENRLNAAI